MSQSPATGRSQPVSAQVPLSTLLGALHDGIVVMAADGAIIECNASAERILGLTADEMAGRTTHDPRWQPIYEDGSPFPGDLHPVTVSLRTGRSVRDVVMGIRKPAGQLTWIRINSQPLFAPGAPAPFAVVASFSDISAQKQAEDRLRDSASRFRLLFDRNPLPMWVYDRETLRFLAVNQAAVERYGYTQEEFSRMTLEDIRPPSDVQRLLSHCRDLTAPPGLRGQGEWRHRTRDGQEIEVEITADELTFGGRAARLVVALEVTERKKLEAHLLHSQKLEAMGRLAGSVAHDFNNVLAVVSGYTDLLFREVSGEDPRRRRLEHIRKALESGATLARQLLAFGRRDPVRVAPLDLGLVVREAEPMVARLLGADHQLVTAVCAGPTIMSADKGQLQQVILNLAANARDAMPRGGQLVIETRSVVLDQAFSRAHLGAEPGPYVVLSVSDTGEGMDAATRSRIFEPFFTTKPKGQGTGLGLATVYDVVKGAGGYISVYTEPGHGTTFNIYFPAVPQRTEAAAPELTPAIPAAGTAGGTILLVEDRDALRSIMRELLESYGYSVLEADRADSALDVAANHAGAIDLLLTDVIMPGMRGPELAAWLRERRPDMRVLFMSGYTDEALAAQGAVERGVLFIQKPFTTADLLGKVTGALQPPA